MHTFITARKATLLAMLLASATAYGSIATFDDLPNPPLLDSVFTLADANNGNSNYQGVSWDARFQIVGDQYRINPLTNPPPNPLFGLPHSGHYFVTNANGDSGLIISTTQILLGAWFGQNEYYGFGGGATQITVTALSATGDLASIDFALATDNSGNPQPLAYLDTGSFAALNGIVGYRIDRAPRSEFAGNWVADDFSFTPVPLPPAALLFASALAGLRWAGKRRKRNRSCEAA